MPENMVWPVAVISGVFTAVILVVVGRPELTGWIQSWVVDAGIAAIAAVDTAVMGWLVLPRFAAKPAKE